MDRVFTNDVWLLQYNNSEARFLSHCISDYAPMITNLGFNVLRGPKPFKFFNHWGKLEEFLPIVKKAWNTELSGTKMFVVVQKLKQVKLALKSLIKENQPNWIKGSSKAKPKLEAFQSNLNNRSLQSGDLANLHWL